jgi:hypothetical protein
MAMLGHLVFHGQSAAARRHLHILNDRWRIFFFFKERERALRSDRRKMKENRQE